MANTTAPQRQIGTRASNKTAHPGNADKSHGRRSSAEVQKERTAKAQAKAAREEAKQNSINRTAEFELADIAEEGLADATPRPPFTPKQWPPPRNQTYSGSKNCPSVWPFCNVWFITQWYTKVLL